VRHIRRLEIRLIERFSWKRRLSIAMGTLAGLWLILEPLAELTTGRRVLQINGWLSFSALLLASISTSVVSEYVYCQRQVGSVRSVAFWIVLVKNGQRVRIVAPRDLAVTAFLDQLLPRIGSLYHSTGQLLHMYQNNLMVRQDDGAFAEVEGVLTLEEAGVSDDCECRLRGTILPRFEIVAYCRGTALDMVRLSAPRR